MVVTVKCKYMMKGESKLNGRSDLRLPITVEMMVKLPNALDHVCKSKYEFLLFMSAFSLSFSASLRVGEIAASNSVDAKKIFQMSNIRIENDNIILVIQYSKTDQIGRSAICKIESVLGQSYICTLKTLKSYLKVRPHTEGPLFYYLNCACLTRNQFVSILHSALKFLGYCTTNINTHSFRIGAATYLALKGESDETMKQKG